MPGSLGVNALLRTVTTKPIMGADATSIAADPVETSACDAPALYQNLDSFATDMPGC